MRLKSKSILLGLLLLLVLVMATTVLAQSSASFDLSWHVTGSGGQESGSASYQLQGTLGQGTASPPTSGSASFMVSSGYWFANIGSTGTILYLPLILKN